MGGQQVLDTVTFLFLKVMGQKSQNLSAITKPLADENLNLNKQTMCNVQPLTHTLTLYYMDRVLYVERLE